MTASGPGEGGEREALSVGGNVVSKGGAMMGEEGQRGSWRGGPKQAVGDLRRQLRNLGLSCQ